MALAAVGGVCAADSRLKFLGDAEACAIGGRADADPPMERAAQDLGATESRRRRDRVERLRALLEQHAATLDPQAFGVWPTSR